MAPIYPDLNSSISTTSELGGTINEAFEDDLQDTSTRVQDQSDSIENDITNHTTTIRRKSLEYSSFRSGKNIDKCDELKNEQTSKKNIYSGAIIPESILESKKRIIDIQPPDSSPPLGNFGVAKQNFHVKYVRPFIYKYNRPPPEPTKWERFKYFISCPPHGNVEAAMVWLISLLFFWACLVYMINADALPGGNIFSILVLAVVAQVVSMVLGMIQIPPLLGMLLTGIVFKSVPGINIVGNSVDLAWASKLKSVALVVILIKAGLGLDPVALKKLSFVVVRIAFTPCLTEAFVDAIVSHYLLGFPWAWAFIQGFVIAAISPAVVVPCLLNLSSRGYGNSKGIPTLLIAGASIDDVVSITGFGIAVGLTFATGSPVWQGFKGPVDALFGVSYGVFVGIMLWYVPSKDNTKCSIFRAILILLAGLLVVFGSKQIDHSGVGAIGCLVTTFVANIGHKARPAVKKGMTSSVFFNYLWAVLCPVIFSLIGTEINVTELDPDTISWGVLTLIIGLACRTTVAFFVVMGAGFTLKERIFIALAWLPKATVQAAIGSTALDMARLANPNEDEVTDEEIMGQKILTVAILAILIAAPIGAAATMIAGPKLLKDTLDPSTRYDPEAAEAEEEGDVPPSSLNERKPSS